MSRLDQAIKLLEPIVNGGDPVSLLVDNLGDLKEVFDILQELNQPQTKLDLLIQQVKARNTPESALAILAGWRERLERFAPTMPPVPDEPEHAIDRSIKLVDEMLAVPAHDPALGFVRKTLVATKATRGSENLGKEGYVVVCDSLGLTDEIVDSLNGFMIAYGTGQHDCKSLRLQAALAGDQAMNVLPKWFAQTYGHVSKGGFTALCYHVLIESQVNPRFKEPVKLLSLVELETIELQMIAGDKQALTKALESK
jgi:hypothetical protein